MAHYLLIKVDMPWSEATEDEWPFPYDHIWIIYSINMKTVVCHPDDWPKNYYLDEDKARIAMLKLEQEENERLKSLDN